MDNNSLTAHGKRKQKLQNKKRKIKENITHFQNRKNNNAFLCKRDYICMKR